VYRIGDHLICIRASEGWLDDALRAALSEHAVPELTAPHANLSIRIERPDERVVGEPVHTLYSSGCLAARSRQPQDVLVALVRELAVNGLEGQGLVTVRCAALLRSDGRALLLSAVARRQLVLHSRRLAEVGLHVIDTPAVLIDPRTLEAVIPGPSFAYDPHILSAISGTEHEDLQALLCEHRYSIGAWIFMSLPGGLAQAPRALALTKAASALWGGAPGRSSDIRTLAAVLRQAETLAGGDLTSLDLIARLAQE